METTTDDDFIGFVLGFTAGDFMNASADYLLIDRKRNNQSFFACTGSAGLSISRVPGVLGNDRGGRCHDPAFNVTELQRAANLGSTGRADNTEYAFDRVFTPGAVKVNVDGVEELSIIGSFGDGSFGFYTYSQQSVRYAGITQVELPPVPLPMAPPLLASGLAAFGLLGLRRRNG